eukprot:13693108-Ditylum_brightwellii.AAC.1
MAKIGQVENPMVNVKFNIGTLTLEEKMIIVLNNSANENGTLSQDDAGLSITPDVESTTMLKTMAITSKQKVNKSVVNGGHKNYKHDMKGNEEILVINYFEGVEYFKYKHKTL